ncbi:MAG: HAD family hydrolase [Halobacteriota archaeon]|jgi:HAD superfamily hydrolase (TIGR01509 family)
MTETEAVLFDAYGTVLDVGTYHRDITKHVVQQSNTLFGIITSVEEFNAFWSEEFECAFRDVIAYCGEFRNMRDLYGISARNVFQRYGISVPDAYVEGLNGIFKKMLDEAVTILPNVKKTLEILCTNGCRLGMVSNGDTEELSAHLNGVSDLFDVIVTSEELEVYKPHSRLFDEAIRKMGVVREATAFVGDTITSDVLGAKKAGLTAIWYNKKKRILKPEIRPDFEIRDMAEILEIVKLSRSGPDHT